jgi:hypothetical protein
MNMNLSTFILKLALLAALLISAVGSRPAWLVPPKKIFGRKNFNRKLLSPQSLSSVAVTMEQNVSVPPSESLDAILDSELAAHNDQHLIPAAARAAAVAFVSAAAIGSTRHALEMILS